MTRKLFIVFITVIILCAGMCVFTSAQDSIISDEGRLPFEDVRENHWFFDSVTFCYANRIVNGMNEYTFGFSGQLTRAQFVTMLANLEGIDTSIYKVDKFTDVKSNHWYYGAVAWAYENGIINGMTDTAFQPNGILTRAQLAMIMCNYMEGKYEVEVSEDILDRFTDKPKVEYWYYDAMKYVVSSELISGVTENTLVSTGAVTRAQAAVIFTSFADKYFYTKCDHFFEEADCTLSERCVYCGMKKGLPEGHTVDSSYNCVTDAVCLVCGADVKASKLIHNFVPATCDMPAVCLDCDTARGTPTNKHNWIPATCTSDEHCSMCGRVGNNRRLGHDEIKPTCTTVGKCRRCGEQTAPSMGHSFSDATCTEARYCKRCNIMSGKPLGHNMVDHVCKRCKYTDITDPVKKTMHYLQYRGNSIIGGGDTYNSRDSMMCCIYRDDANDRVEFSSVYHFTNGARERVELYIYVPKVSNTYEYWAVYYDSNGNKVASGYGSIKPASVYEGMSFTLSNYWGRENLRNSFNSRLAKQLPDTVEACDKLLNKYCDCDIKEFGFKYF